MICRDRSRMSPARRLRRDAVTASMAPRYSIYTSCVGVALKTCVSRYRLYMAMWGKTSSVSLHLRGHSHHVFSRNLLYHLTRFLVHDAHDGLPRCAVQNKSQLVVLAEQIGAVERLDSLDKAPLVVA